MTDYLSMIAPALNLTVLITIIAGVVINKRLINNYRKLAELEIEGLKIRLNENDMQIQMLCNRLKVQREESMAAAIADATMNPEKYTHGSFETLNIAAEKRDDQILESGV